MGRPKEFSDEQLLDALIQFEKISYNKIKITDLLKWSKNNIKGFDNIQYHHFSQNKEFQKKLKEINKMRSVSIKSQENTLLSSSSVNKFLELSKADQFEQIIEARKLFEEVSHSNIYLSRTNEALKHQNEKNIKEIDELIKNEKEIVKKQKELSNKLTYILKEYEKKRSKEMLKEIGIEDGLIDLKKYNDNLLDEVGDFDKKIKSFYMENNYLDLTNNNSNDNENGSDLNDDREIEEIKHKLFNPDDYN